MVRAPTAHPFLPMLLACLGSVHDCCRSRALSSSAVQRCSRPDLCLAPTGRPRLPHPAADPGVLPAGQDSRLAATVALSFSRDTREEFPTLQPPDEGAYLSNMAVDPSFRR